MTTINNYGTLIINMTNHKPVIRIKKSYCAYHKKYHPIEQFSINTITKTYYKCCKQANERGKHYYNSHKEHWAYIPEKGQAHYRGDNERTNILSRIQRYKQQDKKYNRQFSNEIYISYEDIIQLKKENGPLCKGDHCNHCELAWTNYQAREPSMWTLNRIDESKAHLKENCEIICYHCNLMNHCKDDKMKLAEIRMNSEKFKNHLYMLAHRLY